MEYHNLPDTKTRKDCWVEIQHPTVYLEFRKEHRFRLTTLICRYYSTSKETGWDFPLEYDSPEHKRRG